MNIYDYLFKYIIIGDTNVGKSSLLMQFIYSKFKAEYDPTIGVEFGSKQLIIKSNYTIKTQIWDTSGQESFRSITRSYYRGSIGAILVYDITNKNSFENLKQWLDETNNYGNDKMVILLLGNKNDLSEKREVAYEEGDAYAKKNNLCFFEVSAKTGDNIQTAFTKLTEIILNKIENSEINPNNESLGVKKGNKENQSVLSSKFLITNNTTEEKTSKNDYVIGNHRIKKCCNG